MLSKYMDVKIFFITFLVAMAIVYTIQPDPRIIYKHPNPNNAGKLTYKNGDSNDNCYKYQVDQVKCPSDPNLILEHPLLIRD